MARQGIPGVQDSVMPPELRIRPTEVVEYGAPEIDVVEPNSAGTLGHASIEEQRLWDVGLDPYRRLGGDPAGTAMRAGQALVNALLGEHAANQAPMTHILEREGGSEVIYHEPSRDDQSLNVGGVEISNDVEGLELLARNMHTQEYQRSPIGIADSRRLVARLAQSMAGSVRDSFIDVLRNLGMEGAESLAIDPLPGVVQAREMSSDSGVVMSNDQSEAPLLNAMANAAQQQNGNAYRPAALYHPAESNYASPDGQFRGLGLLPTLTAPVTQTTILPTTVISPISTTQFTPTPLGEPEAAPEDVTWRWMQIGLEEYNSVSRKIGTLSALVWAQASAIVPGTGVTARALINQNLAVVSKSYVTPDDPYYGRMYLEIKGPDGYPAAVYRWTAVQSTKTPSISVIGSSDDGTTQSTVYQVPSVTATQALSDMVIASDSDIAEKSQVITAISTTDKDEGTSITEMSTDKSLSELGTGVTTIQTDSSAGVVSTPTATPPASTLGTGDAGITPIIAPVTTVKPIAPLPATIMPIKTPVTMTPTVPTVPTVPLPGGGGGGYTPGTVVPFTPPIAPTPQFGDDDAEVLMQDENICQMVDPQGNIYWVDCAEVPELQYDGLELYVGEKKKKTTTNWPLIGGIAAGAAALIGIAVFMKRK